VDKKAEFDDIEKIIQRARKGDKKALPAISEWMEKTPTIVERMGNMAVQAELSWLDATVGDDLYAKEAVKRKMAAMRVVLSGACPSPLEELLVERIVLCWLQVQYADTIYAQNMGKLDRKWSELHQRRQERYQARYLAAIKALAVVRRLQLPTLQVNIGEKQVNVSGNVGQLPASDSTEMNAGERR